METACSWLDNMSASVNNREAQLRGGYQYSGMVFNFRVERRVGFGKPDRRDRPFMRLAGLGRVNMLGQMTPNAAPSRLSVGGNGKTEPYT